MNLSVFYFFRIGIEMFDKGKDLRYNKKYTTYKIRRSTKTIKLLALSMEDYS